MGYNTNRLFDDCRIGSVELRMSAWGEKTAGRLTTHVFAALESDDTETSSAMVA